MQKVFKKTGTIEIEPTAGSDCMIQHPLESYSRMESTNRSKGADLVIVFRFVKLNDAAIASVQSGIWHS